MTKSEKHRKISILNTLLLLQFLKYAKGGVKTVHEHLVFGFEIVWIRKELFVLSSVPTFEKGFAIAGNNNKEEIFLKKYD